MITPSKKMIIWCGTAIVGLGATATGVMEIQDYIDRNRPWVVADEVTAEIQPVKDLLGAVQLVAESGRDYGIQAYERSLRFEQRSIDDDRDRFKALGKPPPPYINERQRTLNQQKCAYQNSLLPKNSPLRKPCF